MNTTALFTYDSLYNMYVLIPKKRGEGFLKYALGGHHGNDKYRELIYHDVVSEYFGDVTDVDGYVSIEMKGHGLDDTFKSKASEVRAVIKELFPQIRNWKQFTLSDFLDETMKR